MGGDRRNVITRRYTVDAWLIFRLFAEVQSFGDFETVFFGFGGDG